MTRSPALLSLSVEKNLEPTLAFLVKELGLDPGSVKKVTLATVFVERRLPPPPSFLPSISVWKAPLFKLLLLPSLLLRLVKFSSLLSMPLMLSR